MHNQVTIENVDGVPTAAAIAKLDTDADYDVRRSPSRTFRPMSCPAGRWFGAGVFQQGRWQFRYSERLRFGRPVAHQHRRRRDGWLPGIDLVVANAGDLDVNGLYVQFGLNTAVGVLQNTGFGTFGGPTKLNLGLQNGSAFAVAAADINLDGKMDIVVSNFGKFTIFGSDSR